MKSNSRVQWYSSSKEMLTLLLTYMFSLLPCCFEHRCEIKFKIIILITKLLGNIRNFPIFSILFFYILLFIYTVTSF